MTADLSARDALATLQAYDGWALVRSGDGDTVLAVGGSRSEVASLLDVPLEQGLPQDGRTADRLLAIPYRQITERGFEAHDDGTPLVVVDIAYEQRLPLADTLAAIHDRGLEFRDRGGFESGDEEYAKLVEAIIRDEIGQGEGANLVIGRHYRAELADWGADKALTVFKRLCERERGTYWTFCFFTGDRYLVGASPERHVSVQGGFGTISDVRMNPISGTFRLAGHDDPAERKAALLDFLADEKEIYELFMVVDEELKMMCDICHEGGQVLGPFLKPMTHLVHTEYLLAGRTRRDVREVLRDTMYAATVTGSPVQNACRLIKQYETEGRGYYGAALALIGRDREGRTTCDSPIVIRTADVDLAGRLEVTAGATLVRDSDPGSEVAETHAKAGGILSAFGLVDPLAAPAYGVDDLARDEDVLIALNSRNQRLSTFWLTDQAGAPPDLRLAGKHVAILDGEDDFVNMLRHVLGVAGMSSAVVPHAGYADGDLDDADLVIVGPGPGDPRDGGDPKIATFRRAVDRLLAREQPFLAVCLGHQVLCDRLGIPLAYKDIVFQGTQAEVEIDGRPERVGFYNTFVGRVGPGSTDGPGSSDGPGSTDGGRAFTVESDRESGDVHLVRGPHYRGVQFHAESILTEHGSHLVHRLAGELLSD
jgi:2-amino-4-deoxychorismate synthase